MGVRNRFKLNTKGCCFICLKKVLPPKHVGDDDESWITEGMGGGKNNNTNNMFRTYPPPLETFSLQNLCRHLKLDLAKIVSQQLLSPSVPAPKAIPSFESSDVRVVMCGSCGGMVAKFTMLFQELEIIRMKVGHCLDVIQTWIGDTDKDVPRVDQFHKLMASDIQSLVFLEIVEELRKEVSRKCSAATAKAQPKVTLERLIQEKETPQKKIKLEIVEVPISPGSEIKKQKTDDLTNPHGAGAPDGGQTSLPSPMTPTVVQTNSATTYGDLKRLDEVSRKCSVAPSSGQPEVTVERLEKGTPRKKIKPDLINVLTTGSENKKRESDLAKPPGILESHEGQKLPTSLVLAATTSQSVPPKPSTKRNSPSPILALSKEPIPEVAANVRDAKNRSQSTLLVGPTVIPNVIVCNFCQKGFNSLDDLNNHFTAVHLTSMQTTLAKHVESLMVSQQNELTLNTRNIRIDPHILQPEAGKMTEPRINLEAGYSRKPDIETSSAPCKINQVFQITSATKKPVEGPVKVVYVGQRPLIIPKPTVSSAQLMSFMPVDPPPPSKTWDCIHCGKTFDSAYFLKKHINSEHNTTKELPSNQQLNSPIGITAKAQPIIAGLSGPGNGEFQRPRILRKPLCSASQKIPFGTATSPYLNLVPSSLVPDNEDETMNDDDPEIETACFEMSNSTSNYDSPQDVSSHWADPLSDDISMPEAMEVPNNSRKLVGVLKSELLNAPLPGASTIQVHNSTVPATVQSLVPTGSGPSAFKLYNSGGPFPSNIQSAPQLSTLQAQNPTGPILFRLWNQVEFSSSAQLYTNPVSTIVHSFNQPSEEVSLSMPVTSLSAPATESLYYGPPPPDQASFSIHPATGIAECRMCGKEFADVNAFQCHYDAVHSDPGFQVECNLCGNMFGDNIELNEHLEIFHEVKPDMLVYPLN